MQVSLLCRDNMHFFLSYYLCIQSLSPLFSFFFSFYHSTFCHLKTVTDVDQGNYPKSDHSVHLFVLCAHLLLSFFSLSVTLFYGVLLTRFTNFTLHSNDKFLLISKRVVMVMVMQMSDGNEIMWIMEMKCECENDIVDCTIK